jgi:hypothetical protein
MSAPVEGWVYFIRPVGAPGPVKVGYSKWPKSRLNSYLMWSPVPLEIAATVPGARKAEKQFHAYLYEHHSHHEWFKPAPQIDALIASITAGTFDPTVLPKKGRALHSEGPSADAAHRQWLSAATRLTWFRKRGGQVPVDVLTASDSTYGLPRDERDRRRAIVIAFIDVASPPKAGTA